MKTYTRQEVKKLLKEQRNICEETADWLSYPDQKFFTVGSMSNADEPASFDSLKPDIIESACQHNWVGKHNADVYEIRCTKCKLLNEQIIL